MLLIKNADVYAPEYIGKKDILICGEHIEVIADRIENLPGPCKTLEADGMCLTPGFIDQHVHVTGGGGEGSFHTRTPEVELSELIRGGVTTVLGLLGTDGMTRSVENLYAKTAALLEEGVTAYMLTGAYGNPGPTITGEPDRDMVFIREVLGLKLAISDHRAPHVTTRELIRLASKVRVAGMLSGKPGMLVLHMGDDPACLDPVFAALRESQVPVSIFRPTHVNGLEIPGDGRLCGSYLRDERTAVAGGVHPQGAGARALYRTPHSQLRRPRKLVHLCRGRNPSGDGGIRDGQPSERTDSHGK